VSIALKIATRTCSAPIAWARSIAFWIMSTFASRSGAILTAASVMMRGSGWPGTSMMKQWLIRRSVRIPVAPDTTAPISSSVWRLPFMSASAFPARTSSTAFAADAWLCCASTSSASDVETDLFGGPADTLDGTDQYRFNQAQPHCFTHSAHGRLVARVRDSHLDRGLLLRSRNEVFVFFVTRRHSVSG